MIKIASHAERLRDPLQAAKARILKAEQLARRGAAMLSINGLSKETCQQLLEQVKNIGERTEEMVKFAKKGTAATEQSRRGQLQEVARRADLLEDSDQPLALDCLGRGGSIDSEWKFSATDTDPDARCLIDRVFSQLQSILLLACLLSKA